MQRSANPLILPCHNVNILCLFWPVLVKDFLKMPIKTYDVSLGRNQAMLTIFLIPADYWTFLVGLNALLLLLLCLAFLGNQQVRSFFICLGIFAFLQWAQHWLSFLRPVLNLSTSVTEITQTLMVLALASLGIGASTTISRRWLRNSWVFLIILVASLGLVSALRGWSYFFAPVLLGLGLISSTAAGGALARLAQRIQSAAVCLAALALTGYGLSLVLTCPAEYLGQPEVLPAGAFWRFSQTHQPVLQVIFSSVVLVFLWLRYQHELWSREFGARSQARLAQALFFVGAVSLLLALGGVSVGLFGRNLEWDLRESLSQRARMLAAALPVQDVRQLTGSPSDEATAAYANLKRLLGDIRAASRDCRFIYLLRFSGRQPVFLIDSEPEDSLEVSPPGQVYLEGSEQLKAMADKPHAFVEGPLTDRWGTWISAFEVIREPDGGAVLGLLGMDIDIQDWQRKITLQKLLPIGIILLMLTLLTIFFLSQQKSFAASLLVAQSEERYRTLVEGSPNGIYLFDREGHCLAMNRQGLAMLGATASEVLARPFFEHWPQEQRPQVREAFDTVQKGQMINFETDFVSADGQPRFWQVVLNPLQDKKGEVDGSVGILMDITEQRQAEQALQASRALLQSLLEAIPDLLVVIDRDYRIIFSNNAGLCSLNTAAAAGCPTCYQIFHQRQNPCPNCPIQAVFANGQTVEREEFNPTTQGIYEVRAFPVFDSGGQVTMVIEYIRDITARKQVEEALRTREAKLQSVFRAAPVGIGLVENRCLQEVNERLCQLTGYTKEELVGQNARLLYPSQEEYDFVGREKYRQIAQKGVGTVETRWQRRDGAIIDVLLSSVPLWGETPCRQFLFTAMDITEKKKMETLRANLDKMESLGIMAGGIAHDFNNVLMTILGNISLLGMAANPAEIREGLRDAEQACRQAMLLAKQLLTFAKGGVPVKKTAEINLLIEESAHLALSGSNVKISFAWPPDLWQVNVDTGQMHQVFTNLLINADQAMPSGGQIFITAGNEQIKADSGLPLQPGKYVLIKIIDQGVGIAPEHLDKIFDPYFSTKQKGSGLGLTTIYSIIKQHGGFITCESQLGQGTTFALYLPALEQGRRQLPDKSDTLFPGHGRILVLEDEPAVKIVMGKMLTKLGYEAVFAQEGKEVLNLYDKARKEHNPFAAVILDLTIPGGMGGAETCQKLREQDPLVRTIVSSGYADDPVLADFRSFGFVGVIAKPYRLTDLSKVLHQILP